MPAECTARFICSLPSTSAAHGGQPRRCASSSRISSAGSSPSRYVSSFAVQWSAILGPHHLLLHAFTKRFPGPRKPRHHGSNWNRKRLPDFLVRHFLHFAQQKHLAKVYGQRLNGCLKESMLRMLNEDRLRRLRPGGQLRTVISIQRNSSASLQSRARCEESISQYPVHPGAKIRPRLEGR